MAKKIGNSQSKNGKNSIVPDKQDIRNTVLIRKANELVEAKYRFDIWETRIFLKMLTMIKSTDTGFKEYMIYLNEFINDFQLTTNKNVYAIIKDSAEKMMKKVIKTKLMTEDDGLVDFMSPLVTGFKGRDESEGSFIKLSFHPDMKPLLLELSRRYLTYDFRNVANLSSPYYVRLYEILKQYEKIGQRRLTVEKLKELLGVEAEEYKMYGHFKSDVILKAQQRLSEKTDISFGFEEIKRGRRVAELLFKIYPNYQSQLMGDNVDEKSVVIIRASPTESVEEKEDTPVFQKFYPIVGEYWGINAGEFRKRIVGKSEEDIQNAIVFTKEVIKSGAAKNPSGLFLEALTKGLKSKEQVKKELFEEKKRKYEIKITKLNLLVEQLSTSEEAYVKAINDCIRNITQEDPTAAERAIARIKESQKLLGEKMSDKTIEDFRQNEILRGLVKREIMTEYAPKFKPIHDEFLPAIQTLKEQIIEVEPQFQF
jgi:plasmid replication initiation protein